MRLLPIAAALLVIHCAAPRAAAPPPQPPRLEDSCGTVAAFRAALLPEVAALGPGALAAFERWAPPAPVADGDRPVIEVALRRYLEICGEREAIALTQRLISFPTVRAEQPATGPAFEAMAAFLAEWSLQSRLAFRKHGENDAWEVWLGEPTAPANVAFITHADVVPAQEEGHPPLAEGAPAPGWSHPPFTGVVEGDRLFGRGAEDDKGPIAATLVLQRALKAFGLAPRGSVVSIIGTGEEFSWEAFTRYARSQPPPRFPISLDSSYPVVAAESGFVKWVLALPLTVPAAGAERKDCLRPAELRAGQFLTQVPGEAVLTVPGKALLLAGSGVEVEAAGEQLLVRARGEAVHSSVAETGKNALWGLARWAGAQPLCDHGITRMLRLIERAFVDDHHGERLGLRYEDQLMGPLLVIPTLVRVEGDRVVLSVNMRRPAGLTNAQFEARLDAALTLLQREAPGLSEVRAERRVSEPALADLRGRLVPTLLEIYARHTGEKDPRPVAIRGGTYARLFPGAVSFGPALPGSPYRGHAPDEYLELRALRLMLAMNLDAILALDQPAP